MDTSCRVSATRATACSGPSEALTDCFCRRDFTLRGPHGTVPGPAPGKGERSVGRCAGGRGPAVAPFPGGGASAPLADALECDPFGVAQQDRRGLVLLSISRPGGGPPPPRGVAGKRRGL